MKTRVLFYFILFCIYRVSAQTVYNQVKLKLSENNEAIILSGSLQSSIYNTPIESSHIYMTRALRECDLSPSDSSAPPSSIHIIDVTNKWLQGMTCWGSIELINNYAKETNASGIIFIDRGNVISGLTMLNMFHLYYRTGGLLTPFYVMFKSQLEKFPNTTLDGIIHTPSSDFLFQIEAMGKDNIDTLQSVADFFFFRIAFFCLLDLILIGLIITHIITRHRFDLAREKKSHLWSFFPKLCLFSLLICQIFYFLEHLNNGSGFPGLYPILVSLSLGNTGVAFQVVAYSAVLAAWSKSLRHGGVEKSILPSSRTFIVLTAIMFTLGVVSVIAGAVGGRFGLVAQVIIRAGCSLFLAIFSVAYGGKVIHKMGKVMKRKDMNVSGAGKRTRSRIQVIITRYVFLAATILILQCINLIVIIALSAGVAGGNERVDQLAVLIFYNIAWVLDQSLTATLLTLLWNQFSTATSEGDQRNSNSSYSLGDSVSPTISRQSGTASNTVN